MRRLIVCGLLSAFLVAMLAAVAPLLHEQLHADASAPGHDCVVTLMSSGSCDHAAADAVSAAPVPQSPLVFAAAKLAVRAAGRLEFALLEHAPPAHS